MEIIGDPNNPGVYVVSEPDANPIKGEDMEILILVKGQIRERRTVLNVYYV